MGQSQSSGKRARAQTATRIVRKRRLNDGTQTTTKLPPVTPKMPGRLRYVKLQRVYDYLLLEEELLRRCKMHFEDQHLEKEKQKLEKIRGLPIQIGTVDELLDGDLCIVTPEGSQRKWVIPILSVADREVLDLGSTVLIKMGSKVPSAVVGVISPEVNNKTFDLRVEKAPPETYAEIGGLESVIQEIKETVELPLTRPDLYEEMGVVPPRGVILYGPPGCGKTLIAKAVANATSATFIRAVGSQLVQKYMGEGPKLVRHLFQLARDHAPSIIFLDEIDAIGTKRYDASSSGEREVQRTLLELLNQLDGFEARGDVRVIMATNRMDTLDPALIRPGRIDRKIEVPLPDEPTKRKIFDLQTMAISRTPDVKYDAIFKPNDQVTGADIKAICTEAGLRALRDRRMCVNLDDFLRGLESTRAIRNEGAQSLYL